MTLVKTSMLNAIAVTIKILTLLGINKILAIYVGPTGYAALGQFQNAVQMITTFASGAINTGVVKYTAEYNANEEKQHNIWKTAGSIALIGSVVVLILVVSFNKELAAWFLKDEGFSSVFNWFAFALIFFVFNSLFLAVLNGKKEIVQYVFANIIGSVFSLVLTALMVAYYGLYGALMALAIYQSFSFFTTLLLCMRLKWFRLVYFFGGMDKSVAINLAKFTMMAITSAVCVPASHIFIRNHVGETFGWSAAGYWEAMWRLSGAYLMLVTTTLSVYYLPRLSEIKKTKEIKHEIAQGYKIILPVAILCGSMIFLARDEIINILFSREFIPMRDLFAWQITGDTLKIGSWIFAYLMLGKAMVKLFIVTEIFFSCSFVFLVVLFTSQYGLQGTAIAHAVNYLIYWLVVMVLTYRKLGV